MNSRCTDWELSEADEAGVGEVGGVAVDGAHDHVHRKRRHHRRKHLRMNANTYIINI